MKKFLSLIVVNVLFFGTVQLKAQSCSNISVTEVVPNTSLSPCDTVSYFVYTISNANATAVTAATDSIHLPLGISFVSYNSGASTTGISTASIAGTMDPVFSIPTIPAGGFVTISIKILTPCSPDTITRPVITKLVLNSPSLLNCIKTVGNTMTVTTPSLSETSVGSPFLNLNTGDIQDLVYLLKNPSAAGRIPNVKINCSPDGSTVLQGFCISTSAASCPGPYSTIVGGVINITGMDIQSLLGHSYRGLGPGDSIYVHIKFKVTNCSNAPNGAYTFSWGCNPTSCQTIPTSTDINSFATSPLLQVTTLAAITNSSYCPGGTPIQMGFIYTNNGATLTGPGAPPLGNAKLVDLNLYIASSAALGIINPNTFRVNGNPTYMPYGPVVSFYGTVSGYDVWRLDFTQLSTALFAGNPSPFGINSLRDIDGDGKIDDLREGGDNFTLTFDYSYATTCPAPFASTATKYIGVSTQEKFQNQCGTLADVHTITYSVTNTSDASYFYESLSTGSTIVAPPDVVEGDTIAINICPHFAQLWGPQGYDFACPNGYHQFKMNLPPGYHIDLSQLTPASNGGSMLIPLYERCTAISLNLTATVTEFPPVGATPGYVLINSVRIPTNNCGPWMETDNVLCFNVKLYFECSSNPFTANFGADSIGYTIQYICDPACITCADNISNANTSTYHHCNGTCTKPFYTGTKSFTFKRTTLGYLNSATPLDVCTNPPTNVLATSAIDLTAAYPGDAIEAKLTGGFTGGNGSSYSAMFMQVRYDKLLAADAMTPDLFIQDPLVPSTIKITSVNLGLNILDTVTYTYTNSIPAEMNFKISPAIYPLLMDTDIVFSADIHLIAKSSPQFPSSNNGTFYSFGKHKLSNLRAEFAGRNATLIPPNDTTKSCDSWGSNFTMLQPRTAVFYYPDLSFNPTSDCDPYQVSFIFRSSGALWPSGQDDFPNEFRPYSKLDDSVTIILPPGYQYTSTTMGVVETNYSSTGPNFFQSGNFNYAPLSVAPYSVTTGVGGTTLKYNGRTLSAACWPLLDSKYWYAVEPQYDITVHMKPTCDAPDTAGFTMTTGYTQSIQQSNPSYQFHTNVNYTPSQLPVYHKNPTLNITTTATVNAYSNIVTFNFTVCNNSAFNAPNAWVTLQSPGGTLSFTGVTIPPNPALLSSVPYGIGGLLVNLGAVPANQCKTFQLQAMVTAGGCVTGPGAVHDSILVGWGNECTVPVTANTENVCQQGSTFFNFLRFPSALNLLTPSGFPITAVNLCGDTLTYNFNITNPALGTVTTPNFWMDLPFGINFQTAKFTYPYSTGTVVTSLLNPPTNSYGPLSNKPGWNLAGLYPSTLGTNGLTGSLTTPNNQIGVQIKVTTSCGYDPNDHLKFYAGGTSACSQPILTPPAEHRPAILNASISDSLSIVTNLTDTALNCTDVATYSVAVTNNGVAATANSNVLTVVVPNAVTYSSVSPPASVSVVGSNTYLTWNLPVITSGNTQTFTFNIGLYNNFFCGPLSINAYTSYTDSIYCASTNSSCTIHDTSVANVTPFSACCGGCTLSAGADQTICYGASATLTATGGAGYTWMPGSLSGATVTVSPSTTTSYTVSSINADGSSCYDVVTVNVLPQINVTLSNIPIACNGGNSQITAIVSGGTPGYTYLWSPAGGAGSVTSPVPAGIYTVIVTDSGNCTATQAITVTQPTAVLISSFTQTNVSCFGGNDGTATVTPSGGTPAYTYSWAPAGGTGATATGLTPGSYTVTATDANGCTTTHVFVITQPSQLIVSGSTQTNVLCNGGNNGTATVFVSGGTPSYTYAWSPFGGTAATGTGLNAGSYTVTITDANGCTITQSYTITEPPLLSISNQSQVNVTCYMGNNGTATVSVTGGTAAYSYLWTPFGGTGSTGTGLSVGSYAVIVTDANGCTATSPFFTITQPALLFASNVSQTNVGCFGGNNGTATTLVTGGTPGYTYLWSPTGGTGPTGTGMSAGAYTCLVTDANNCTSTAGPFTITQPSALSVSLAQTTISCNGGNNGTATANASGGTPGYAYSWLPTGGTGSTATGLSAGTYTVTVTDLNGCSVSQSLTITAPPALTITSFSQTNASCFGSSSGTATVNASGGTPSYTYAWTPSGGTAATATGLSMGSYTCTVTDANGCQATHVFTITQPMPIVVQVESQINAACGGACNGVASITVSGGTPGYTYLWTPSGGTNSSATGLCAGSYTVTVTDASGCTATHIFTITQPPALTISSFIQTNVSCSGGNNGSASVSVSGGTPAYTYSWSPSGGTGNSASGLVAGTYTVTATDAHGCTTTHVFTIIQPAVLVISTFSQTNVTCFGAVNGTATVVASGGTPAYTYAWTPSGGTAATATGLAAGTYTCTVTDAHGCTTSHVFTITRPARLVLNGFAQTNITCAGACNGVASVIASGGTPAYTYAWAPSGGTAPTATGLCAGNYTVTVTDANGCTATHAYTITQPAPIATSSIQHNVNCNGGNNGTIFLGVSGGSPGYTFLWAPGGQTVPNINHLTAGSYTCTITDSQGCTATITVTITQPPILTLSIASVTHACYGTGGGATVTASGGTPSYTYSWSPGGGTSPTISGKPPGTYVCTVTDANGCTATASVNIRNSAMSVTGNFCTVMYITPGNLTPTETLTSSVTGGFGPYTYNWSCGGTASATTITTGSNVTCNLTVTDAVGCTVTVSYVVFVVDARCGHGLTKVLICGGGGTACIAPSAVSAYLAMHPGSHIGPCMESPCLSAFTPSEGDTKAVIIEEEEGYFSAAPNPLTESTKLQFGLLHADNVILRVFDLTGKEVSVLYNGMVTEGESYTFEFNVTDLPSGLYIAELKSTLTGKGYRLKLLVQK